MWGKMWDTRWSKETHGIQEMGKDSTSGETWNVLGNLIVISDFVFYNILYGIMKLFSFINWYRHN